MAVSDAMGLAGVARLSAGIPRAVPGDSAKKADFTPTHCGPRDVEIRTPNSRYWILVFLGVRERRSPKREKRKKKFFVKKKKKKDEV